MSAIAILACVVLALGLDVSLDPDRRASVKAWWRRVNPWGWVTVRDTGITRYQVHPSGRRRAIQRWGSGYQPIDRQWLETGEWRNRLR